MEDKNKENNSQSINKKIERMVLLIKDSETIWLNLKSFRKKEDGTPYLFELNINLQQNERIYNWALEEMEKPEPATMMPEKEAIELEERLLFAKESTIFCPFCGSVDLDEQPLKFSKKVKSCKRLKKVRKRFKKINLFSCNHCGKDFAAKRKDIKNLKKGETK